MKKDSNVVEVVTYVAPMIEVYDIVLEQSVLQASSDIPDATGETW